MKMVKYIFIVLFFFVSLHLKADGVFLIGKVYSADNTPLKNASVVIMNADSSFVANTETSKDGIYSFKSLSKQNYIIQFSCLGFETRTIDTTITNDSTFFKDVTLNESSYTLNEVTVNAPRYVRTDNSLIVYPTEDMVKSSYSPFDLLSNMKIPGIITDRQNRTVKHFNTEVTLYINGEKADQRRILSLRPSHIDKVEYIDNPIGKYSNDEFAINIITKNANTGGYVSFEVAERIGYEKGEYNISSQFSSKKNMFSFWGGVNHTGSDGVSMRRTEFIEAAYRPLEINKELLGEGYRLNEQYFHAQMSRIFKSGSWILRLGFINSVSPYDDNTGKVVYKTETKYEKIQYSHIKKDGFSPKISWYGDFKFSTNSELTYSMNVDYNHIIYDRTYTEDDYTNHTHAKNRVTNASAEINYNYKFKNRNVFSVTAYNFLSDARTNYSGNNVSTQHLLSDESLLFIGYKLNLPQNVSLYLRPGLSVLRQRLNDTDKNEVAFRLHSRLAWKISRKHYFTLKYNIGNTTADISSSSNLDQEIDLYHIKRGNPNLKSSHLYRLSFEYMFIAKNFNLTIGGDYNSANNFPLMTPYLEENKIIETYSSDVKSKEYDIGAVLTYSPLRNFSIQGMLLFTKLKTDKWNIYDKNILMGNINFAYNIKKFSFNISMVPPYNGIKSGKGGMYAKYKSDWQYNFSCSWRKGNLCVEFETNNIFSSKIANREYLNTSFYGYTQEYSSKSYQKTAVLRILYSFDFGNKKVKKEKPKLDNSIKDTILM